MGKRSKRVIPAHERSPVKGVPGQIDTAPSDGARRRMSRIERSVDDEMELDRGDTGGDPEPLDKLLR